MRKRNANNEIKRIKVFFIDGTKMCLVLKDLSYTSRRVICILLLCGALSACSNSSIAYYSQSVIGHSRLMLARQPVEKVLQKARESQNTELVTQLILAQELKSFATNELSLVNNNSYTSYVALEREFPVWTVVAAGEFSLQAKNWCYPIVGCAAYRGYFSKQAAIDYAASQQSKGLETTVGGVGAYSTLGWFNDPLLPSMMRYGEADFAETLFHELAHQMLYIKGDSGFNEAFATVIGEQGALKWLKSQRPKKLAEYQLRLSARSEFNSLLKKAKQALSAVYDSTVSDEQKRADKKDVFISLEREYQQLKIDKWHGRNWFDGWFSGPMNNARLASFATYRDKVPAFYSLLDQCKHDFKDCEFSRRYSSGTQQMLV